MELRRTRSFCVIPFNILLSHSGAFPFSVANWTLNPAFMNAVNGIAVSTYHILVSFS